MSAHNEQKLAVQTIPGMNRHERFGTVQYAETIGATSKRILTYFTHEKTMVLCMLIVVILGTLCGIYAPSLQSNAIDCHRIKI